MIWKLKLITGYILHLFGIHYYVGGGSRRTSGRRWKYFSPFCIVCGKKEVTNG